jgi:hypothetical protein
MRTKRIQLSDLFRHELTMAQTMGFELQCRITDGAVAARMQPRTDRAHQACAQASGKAGQAIESSAPVEEGHAPAEVLRDTIRSVLDRAREVMA